MSYNAISFGLKEDDVVGFTEAQRTSVEMLVTFSVVSEGPCEYKNLRQPRHENFYGYAQIMTGAFVWKTINLAYLNQQLLHFQQSSTDINQSIGCGVKKILENLPTPVSAQVTTYLLRQPYTSIRFKLRPGVLANVNINWHFPEQLCDDLLVAPPSDQGNPSAPTNGSYSPGSRPGNQGGDPQDNSPNDGKPPTGDQGTPPAPGGGGGTGTWKVLYSAYNYADQPFTVTVDSFVTDAGANVTAIAEPTGGPGNSQGKSDSRLVFIINGVSTPTQGTGFGMNVFSPYYSN